MQAVSAASAAIDPQGVEKGQPVRNKTDLAHSPVILIVEDYGEIRRVLVSFFREMGWVVLEAMTGEQAVAFLDHADHIDAVFTDLKLGGNLNGWDVGEAFYSARPDLLVIYGSGVAVEPARPVPGSKFFSKPYSLNELAEACVHAGSG